MVSFSKLVLTTASAVVVAAAPWEPSSKYSTHGTKIVSRDFYVETYHPENIYKTFGDGVETPLKKRGEPGSIENSASSFVESQLGVGAEGFKIRSSSSTDIGGHVYFQQLVVRETPQPYFNPLVLSYI
jgi:extracellular elastinolytic metalloproteinase